MTISIIVPDIVAYGPVAKRWLWTQRSLLGNTRNMHACNNRTVFLCGPCRDVISKGQIQLKVSSIPESVKRAVSQETSSNRLRTLVSVLEWTVKFANKRSITLLTNSRTVYNHTHYVKTLSRVAWYAWREWWISCSSDWIYYHLGYTLSLNHTQIQAIQRYRWFTHFPIHRCTRTRILFSH
jgi:hypothetical protein